jgi:hypothetical protein
VGRLKEGGFASAIVGTRFLYLGTILKVETQNLVDACQSKAGCQIIEELLTISYSNISVTQETEGLHGDYLTKMSIASLSSRVFTVEQ